MGLDNADDAQRELENAVKEVFAWADNQKALQIATMHTNAFLAMQRRLRLVRGSQTAPMTPMVLRLGHETLFFDERYAQFVPLSSDITERMDADPNALFLGWRDNGDEVWLDRSRTAPRGACPQPRRRQFSRGAPAITAHASASGGLVSYPSKFAYACMRMQALSGRGC